MDGERDQSSHMPVGMDVHVRLLVDFLERR